MAAAAFSTHGWDMVHALRIPEVNKHITERSGAPRWMQESIDDMEVTALVGGWRVVQGGANSLICLSLGLDEGAIVTPAGKRVAFGGQAIVAVELEVLHWDVSGGRCATLQLPSPGTQSGVRPFYVRELVASGTDNAIVQGVIKQAVQQWLNHHPDAIQHVFATIDLQDGTGRAEGTVMRPTRISYAYHDAQDINDCLLAVLVLTDGAAPSGGLDQVVSPESVPPGCDCGVLLSSRAVLDSVVRRAAMSAFKGTSASDYEQSPVVPVITLKRPRDLPPVPVKGSDRHHVLQSFSASITGASIVCQSESVVLYDEGVSLSTFTHAEHTLVLEKRPDGSQWLRVIDLSPAQISHETHIDPEVQAKDERIADAIMIGGAILSLFGGPLCFVVVTIETAIVSSVMAKAPELIAAMAEPGPSQDIGNAEIAAPSIWSGGRALEMMTLDMDGGLRLGARLV